MQPEVVTDLLYINILSCWQVQTCNDHNDNIHFYTQNRRLKVDLRYDKYDI